MRQTARNQAVPFYEKGNRQFAVGKYAAAEKSFRRAVKINPGFGEAYNNLGNALRELGRYEAAAQAYSQARKSFPSHPMVLGNLGAMLHFLGRSDEACELLKQALEFDPRHLDAHNNLGLVHKDAGRLAQALSCFSMALSLDPSCAETHNNIASVWMIRKDFWKAREYLDHAIRLKPDFEDARINLSIALMHIGYQEDAVELVMGVLEKNPRNCDALNALGRIRTDMGDAEEALEAFQRSLNLNLKPRQKETLMDLGRLYRVSGHTEQAAEQFQRAYELDRHDGATLAALDEVAGDDGRRERVITMERILETTVDIHPAVREATLFGLGRALESLGEPVKAMQAYLEANHIHRRSIDYSEEKVRQNFLTIQNRFDSEFIAKYKNAGFRDSRPIFILGMPRSGTSLVEQILASHPSVHGAGELKTLNRLVRARWGKSYAEQMGDPHADDFTALGAEYCEELTRLAANAPRVTDKMPHNFLYLGLIRLALPEAKVIHCIRDPMDNCLSIFKNLFGQAHPYAYDLEELGRYYRLYQDLITHLKETVGEFVMDLHYEQLVAEQEEQTRRLLAFCGLKWDDACLSFHQTQRSVNTLSAVQVRRRIYTDSVGRWKRLDQELAPLRRAIEDQTHP